MAVFNETIIIIPLTLIGYEMLIANSVLHAHWLSTISYPTHVNGIIIVNYTTAQKMSKQNFTIYKNSYSVNQIRLPIY